MRPCKLRQEGQRKICDSLYCCALVPRIGETFQFGEIELRKRATERQQSMRQRALGLRYPTCLFVSREFCMIHAIFDLDILECGDNKSAGSVSQLIYYHSALQYTSTEVRADGEVHI